MQIVFRDGADRRELDLRVNDPAATVGDLIDALDPGGPPGRRLSIGDRVVAAELGLDECGLHEGAEVAVTALGAAQPDTGATTLLELVGGLDAGRHLPLRPGTSLLGRDAGCDLVVASASLSRRHAELTLREDGHLLVRDLGSLNGTWVAGRPVVDEAVVAPGEMVQFGTVQAVVRTPAVDDRPMAIDALRHAGAAGTIPFNRPPRPAPPAPPVELEVPGPPRERNPAPAFNVVAFVAPLLLAGGLYVATRQVGFLAFTLLSPIMVLGTWAQGRVQGRRGSRRDTQEFGARLAAFRQDLAAAVADELARRDRDAPDAGELVRRAVLPSTRLWERRPHHPDFLVLRAGVGDVPWDPPVGEVKRDAPEEVGEALAAASVLPRAPATIDLSGGGVVGIVGDRPAALALARSLVGQAAVHHGPADLPMAVLAGAEHASDWDWAKWLPHTRDQATGTTRLLSGDGELSNRMAEAWLAAAVDAPAPGRSAPAGPTSFVVVDDETLTEGRRASVRSMLRGAAGPVAGIVIAGTADRLPAVCTTVVELRGPDGDAALHVPQRNYRVDRFVATGMADDTARRCAQALARFEDAEVAVAGAGLPSSVRLLPLLDHGTAGGDLDAAAVQERWRAAGVDPAPRAPVGVAEDGVFTVDLAADGPHALVGGTTGSGKSELLRTLVAGLAAGVDPDHLTFVLIDFKGGSAFDECARLPHTVGMVTDLDEHLAERALRCLEAELKHRERVLRAAGAADLPAYLRGGRGAEPLPRLVVVIDEFATLKAELPDFVDALVGVAQRGRSLGVHMVLATQRPSGAVSENIRANTNLRIALRVQDEGDSTDIIDRPDAAHLPRHAAGRAYVRLGAGEVVAIQTALATAARTGGPVAAVDLAPFVFGPVPRAAAAASVTPADAPERGSTDPAGDRAGPRATDLGVLVSAVAEAHRRSGRPAPRRPWPDPLPTTVDLDDLLAAVPPPSNGAALPEVTLALADDPDGQAQHPVGWRPDDGNLLVYGVGGAGTTTTLGTVALSLARSHPPDRLHLYALDFGAGELGALAGLPHVGAVIGAPERERQMRLVRHLRGELDRRRLLPAGDRVGEPAVVVLLDGWAAFDAEYRDLVGSGVMDELQRVFADGPEVGIHMVVAADRTGAVPSTMASLVRQKLLMRLADPYDYAQFGIAAKAVPDLAPGGALLAESKQVVQVATPAGGLAAAVDRGAALHPPAARPPAPIGQLPAEVAVSDLAAPAELGDRPWLVPVGIGEADLGPARLVVHEGEHALVAGPGRSGKTSALAAIAEACRAARPDLGVVTVAPSRSPLPALVGPDQHVPPDELDGLGAVSLPHPDDGRPALVLVDDADAVEDPTGVLEDLLAAHRPDLLVVAAGRAENLRGSFGHWTRALRRSKLGVLLQPNLDLDGELLGVTLPRRLGIAMTVGRGLMANGGELEIVQLARPTAPAGRAGRGTA